MGEKILIPDKINSIVINDIRTIKTMKIKS